MAAPPLAALKRTPRDAAPDGQRNAAPHRPRRHPRRAIADTAHTARDRSRSRARGDAAGRAAAKTAAALVETCGRGVEAGDIGWQPVVGHDNGRDAAPVPTLAPALTRAAVAPPLPEPDTRQLRRGPAHPHAATTATMMMPAPDTSPVIDCDTPDSRRCSSMAGAPDDHPSPRRCRDHGDHRHAALDRDGRHDADSRRTRNLAVAGERDGAHRDARGPRGDAACPEPRPRRFPRRLRRRSRLPARHYLPWARCRARPPRVRCLPRQRPRQPRQPPQPRWAPPQRRPRPRHRQRPPPPVPPPHRPRRTVSATTAALVADSHHPSHAAGRDDDPGHACNRPLTDGHGQNRLACNQRQPPHLRRRPPPRPRRRLRPPPEPTAPGTRGDRDAICRYAGRSDAATPLRPPRPPMARRLRPSRARATRMPATDTDNPDELERAIKQFGWSGGDTMPRRRADETGSP